MGALARYCDLAKAPNKKLLQAIAPKLENPAARERVSKLAADAELLKKFHAAPLCCRMHEFWALLGVRRIDPATFFLHCPRQKPREFTIASSPKATSERITLCVSLTSHELADVAPLRQALQDKGLLADVEGLDAERGRFFGACSRWLTSKVKIGDTVLAKQRPSPLRLPAEDVPIVMVGAGAGVAPFRGFWEELRLEKRSQPATLFFGCRHPEKDWIYRDEMCGSVKPRWSQTDSSKPLAAVHTAFSRPSEGTGCYVQDLLRKEATSLKQWLEKSDGRVFICGSSAMGRAVLDVLGEVLEGGRDAVETLRKENRVVAEMWG